MGELEPEKKEAPSVDAGGAGDRDGGQTRSIPIIADAFSKANALLGLLLDGEEPAEIPNDRDFPFYAELKALADARASGGKEGARRAFEALARQNPRLAELRAGSRQGKRYMAWRELLYAEIPQPEWVIQNLLPVGLVVLAGRPKVGKSWLGLQVAQAVATGGLFLGERAKQGPVLYLALEDGWFRIRERGKEQGLPEDAPVLFAKEWEPLCEGGLATLQETVERERPLLVVLDTFSRLAGRADQQDVGEMTVLLANLQRMALDYGLSVLAIDHHRKNAGFEANPVDDVLGSTAKSAVTDALWGLYREQGAHTATLRVLGRDLAERELALTFDGLLKCWQLQGDAGEVRKDTLRANILSAIKELTALGEIPSTAAIARHLGANKGSVSHELAELLRLGRVFKGELVGKAQPYYLARPM